MLQIYVSGVMFQRYVASVSDRYCKSRSGCCTCCNGYICMLQVYVSNVSDVSEVCCKCLYIDVAKVDRDVAHVVMAIHVCFKCMFQIFHLFQTNVASVLSRCCKSSLDVAYTCILQAHVSSVFRVLYVCSRVFHLNVAYVCNDF